MLINRLEHIVLAIVGHKPSASYDQTLYAMYFVRPSQIAFTRQLQHVALWHYHLQRRLMNIGRS